MTSMHRFAFRLASSHESIRGEVFAKVRHVTRIRLIKKLAALLNGVDLSSLRVGDMTELPDKSAAMLIAEGWAEPAVDPCVPVLPRSTAARSNLAN